MHFPAELGLDLVSPQPAIGGMPEGGPVGAPIGGSEATEQHLYATYFGTFELFRANRAVALGRGTLASRIGCYLIARSGLPVPREELCDWLWPDADVRLAAHRLQVAVTDLRRHLDPPGATVSLVRFDAGAYSVKADTIRTDCDLFEGCYRRAQDHLARRQWDRSTAEFATAVALYTADYLVDNPYAEWTHRRRAYFAERRLSALTFLCDIAAAQDRPDLALEYALRILETDNLRERAHRHLMRAHYLLGQRACALRHYRAWVESLWREMGVQPSQPTQLLYRAIIDEAALPAEPGGLA